MPSASGSASKTNNLAWLKWNIGCYRSQSLQVHLLSIRLGNTAIDGEAFGNGYRIALEIKTARFDLTVGWDN
jgi:hypothetical protein